MNTLQKHYLIFGGLLAIGIPLFIIGIIYPSSDGLSKIKTSLKYTFLDDQSITQWGSIPGSKNVSYLKSFYLFECTNFDAVPSIIMHIFRSHKVEQCHNYQKLGPFYTNILTLLILMVTLTKVQIVTQKLYCKNHSKIHILAHKMVILLINIIAPLI